MILQTHRLSFIKVKALVGEEWDCENWGRDIGVDTNDARILNP